MSMNQSITLPAQAGVIPLLIRSITAITDADRLNDYLAEGWGLVVTTCQQGVRTYTLGHYTCNQPPPRRGHTCIPARPHRALDAPE